MLRFCIIDLVIKYLRRTGRIICLYQGQIEETLCSIVRIEIWLQLMKICYTHRMSRNETYHSCDSLTFLAFILSCISSPLSLLAMIYFDFNLTK